MVSNADAIARPGAAATLLRRQGGRVLRSRINALLGATVGGAMLETVARVQAVQQPQPDTVNGAAGANGGLMPVVTEELIDRVTVTNDVSQVRTILRDRATIGMLDYTTLQGQTDGNRVTETFGVLLGIDFILDEDVLG